MIALRVLNMIYVIIFFNLSVQLLGVFFHGSCSGIFRIGSGFLADLDLDPDSRKKFAPYTDPDPDKRTRFVWFQKKTKSDLLLQCHEMSSSLAIPNLMRLSLIYIFFLHEGGYPSQSVYE